MEMVHRDLISGLVNRLSFQEGAVEVVGDRHRGIQNCLSVERHLVEAYREVVRSVGRPSESSMLTSSVIQWLGGG